MPATAVLLVEDSAADASLIQRAAQECDRNIELWTMTDASLLFRLHSRASVLY
jgi:hypothetical protein